MAGLFKNKIIKDKVDRFQIPNFEEKLSLIQSWHKTYTSGELQTKNETQCEQAFNQDFFISILGYTQFPKETYTIQPKDNVETGGGQIPDATLGFFKGNEKRVIAVVEIKDANTALDKSQRREGNLSPIQQAFKYKPQFKECGFVIATNFVEIRVFRDNQLDYEKFTLSDLVNPDNDYFNFRKFYFLLCAQNFVAEIGQTETEKLLSAIRIEQEKITDKFYKEYKQLREDLIRDIVENNKIKRADFYNHVVEKAQKIVDRVVFICFFEDAGLLPEGKLTEVVEYAQKGILSEPIWDTLKKFFKAIDEGSDKLGVPNGYNGELFKNDDDLNNLKISDTVCRRFINLSNFDFEEDLSVNILGHIFEQSITDLERLKNYSESVELVEGKDTKRKKDGIFYTPEYIVDYIVKNTLGRLFEEKEKEILDKYNLDDKRVKEAGYNKKIIQAYSEYNQFLRNIKVLDPACGSGAFLVKVFDYLLAEHKRVFRIANEAEGIKNEAVLFSDDDFIKPILENNIYGVDLNPESVEITKLSLWLKSAKKGKKLITLKNNIKCGNSLINSKELAGDRSFDWSEGFPEIIANGGFDVIVGNPPYVRQEHIKIYSDYLSQNYEAFSGKADLYVYFFEKALELLKPNGIFGYISSGKFFEASYGKPLASLLATKSHIVQILDFGDYEVFKGVSAYPIIFVGKKELLSDYEFSYQNIDNAERKPEQLLYGDKQRINIKDFQKNGFKFIDNFTANLFEKLFVNSTNLKDLNLLPLVGVKTGFNDAYLTNEKEGKYVKPYVFGKDIKRYGSIEAKEKIVFPYEARDGKYELVDVENNHYLAGLLEPHKEQLSKRAIIKEGLQTGSKVWYEYQQIKKNLDFDNEYIVYPNVSLGTNFALSKGSVIDMTGFVIPSNDRFLLGILNSKLTQYLMEIFAISRRGGYLEYKVQYLEKIPVKNVDDATKISIAKKVDSLLGLVGQLSEVKKHFWSVIGTYSSFKKAYKNDDFYTLVASDLINNSSNHLDITQREELTKFFNSETEKALNLKEKIEDLDREINDEVFDIYDLTPEERKYIISQL